MAQGRPCRRVYPDFPPIARNLLLSARPFGFYKTVQEGAGPWNCGKWQIARARPGRGGVK